MKKNKIIDISGGGLKKLPEDKRDFSLASLYIQCNINEVLGNFIVADPLTWKDQKDTDFCSAFAVTEVSEDQEGEELLPEYQFFKTKVLMGGDMSAWGADLRASCKVPVSFGSLPKKGYEKYSGLSREVVLDPRIWLPAHDLIAAKYKKQTFFDATKGRYDLFDNLRTHLWQHRGEKCTIVTGAAWRSLWTNAPDGIIPKTQVVGEFGHAFKLYGSKIINGEPYLIAQLSNGQDIGDRGKFYFPRDVVNREFKDYGAFMFKDLSRETAEAMLNSGTKISTTSSFWQFIINFFRLFKP